MKKLLLVLFIVLSMYCAHSEEISSDPYYLFPDVSVVAPLPHFDGDNALYSVSLYSLKNANYYYDCYVALVANHNIKMGDARALSETNFYLNAENKKLQKEIKTINVKRTIGAVVIGVAAGIVVRSIWR